MKFTGVAAVEIIGGIVVGCSALLSFWDFTTPVKLKSHSGFTRSNQFQMVKPDDSSGLVLTVGQPDELGNVSGKLLARDAVVESKLRYKVELLERGMRFLDGVTDYTAILQKQEVVGGELLDEQTVAIKCRHNPFSIYMAWLSAKAGREVLFVDGQNSGKMIVHDGGWKARIPALSVTTNGSLAMQDTRYPVTTAGLLGLSKTMLEVHREDLVRSNFASCEVDRHQRFDGRPCLMFTIRYKSARDSPIYRKSITLIDHEWNVPLYTRHFEWPKSGNALTENELDETTLIECYSFSEVKLRCQLTDHDFDRTNQGYHFR